MPSNISATAIRIEPEVKKGATAILDELRLSMSSAVNMFLRAMIREGGLPFEMKVAPKEPAASVNIADRERERERVSRRFAPTGTASDGRWS